MSFVPAAPTIQFLQSLLLGAVLSLLYDIFHVIRSLFPPRFQPHILLDILYFILFGILLFDFLLLESNGRLRYFIILGISIGWLVYHNTCSRLFMRVFCWLLEQLRRLLTFLLRPFLRLVGRLATAARQWHINNGLKCKTLKNRLKKKPRLLYNKLSKKTAEATHFYYLRSLRLFISQS